LVIMMFGTPSVDSISAADAPAGPDPMTNTSVSTVIDSAAGRGSGC